jgi:serine O-acetyltransferase
MSIKLFCADLQALSKSSSIFVNAKWFFFNHAVHLVFLFRLGQDLRRIHFFGKIFRFIVEYLIRVVYASDISCRAQIGKGFVIVHGHDIVIGADVVIGENCTIFNGVTLGNKDLGRSSKNSQPKLGDNVVLSTGVKVLGSVSLGNNVVVGANAVVVKNFPSNVTLVGVPAKVIGACSEDR